MKELSIKPYAIVTVKENYLYRIARFNVLKQDWEEIPISYNNKESVQNEIDQLNQESGCVPFILNE